MIYLVAALVALSVVALVLSLSQIAPAEPDLLRRLRDLPGSSGLASIERYRREERAARLRELLSALGRRLTDAPGTGTPQARRLLIGAGFVGPGAVAVFYGAKIAGAVGIGLLFFLFSPAIASFLGLPREAVVLIGLWGAAMGWVLPTLYVRRRANTRKREILKGLPDALDLMVVCVESGLGINQALQRVAEEIALVSPALSEQMGLVTLEIRAGTARDEALRHFAERTDLDDVSSLATVLIQTERFGTSVSQALRTHSDVLRTKRRQRVEEAAAKTAIKMLFPLVFCIFPALFVVILGPGILQALKVLGGM
jgi:tight adherence protein C